MNCTQCGVKLEPGQRFCIECGAPVESASFPREDKPEMDLSEYFDDAPARTPGPAGDALRPVSVPRPKGQTGGKSSSGKKSAPGKKSPAGRKKAAKSDRGLNIALMICGMLAIAVLVFMIFLLLWPKSTPAPAPAQQSPQAQPVATQEPQNIVIPTPDTAGQIVPATPTPVPALNPDTPIVVITPSPLPSAVTPAPVVPATPSPTPGAVAVVTPPPTPGPDYLLPNSDSHYLTVDDIKGLTHEELCFARNEIFARHGRIFKTPQLAAYFNSKSWYHGTISPDKFDENVLNKYEWANVNLIKEYENKYYGGSYY